MTVFKLYFDKDHETKWLNEMADKGFAMVDFKAGFYTFEETEPGEYVYQVDITKGLFSVTDDYREFMKEMDTEIVALWGPWVILRKKKELGEFELYTDPQSQIEHYKKILVLFKIVTGIEFACFFLELYAAMKGNNLGIIFMFVIALMLIVFIRMIAKTKKRIDDIQKAAGIISNQDSKYKGAHPTLLAGLFFNMIGVFLNNHSTMNDYVKGVICGLACVLMLVGIYLTFKNMNQDSKLE